MPVTAGVRVVSVLLILVPFFGFFAASLIPAYQDYTVRVKIVGALTDISALKIEIHQAYAQKQPVKTGSIQVASPSVKSVEVNSIGVIVITLF